MQELLEAFAGRASAMDNMEGRPRFGIVASVEPSGPSVRVRIQPEDVLSGWLPILSPAGGDGAAVVVPKPGWVAFLVPDLGDAGHGVVLGFVHTDGAPLPSVPEAPGAGGVQSDESVPARSGEWIVRAFGSVIRMTPSGDIYMRPASGTVKIDGNLTVNGNVSDKIGSLDRLRTRYNAHIHTGPGSGPLPQDT